MTWGEIREELAQRFPGVSLDLLTSFIRKSYDEILNAREWSRLTATAVFQTTAKYSDGTVALVAGSNAVVGTATVFTQAMDGLRFRVAGSNVVYGFSVVDDTNGLLDRPYEGGTGAGLGYDIFEDRLYPDVRVHYVTQIFNPRTGLPLAFRSGRQLRVKVNACVSFGEPMEWAPDADTDELTPPVAQSLRLWPAPMTALGLPYAYQVAPFYFDGTNTAAGPLPWISAAAITAGAAARIASNPDRQTDQMEFDRSLARMHMAENERIPAPVMQMADRFTRHRIGRSCR